MHPHTAHDLNRQAVTSSTVTPGSSSSHNVTPVKTNHVVSHVTSDADSSSPVKRKNCRLDKSAKKHKKKHKHHHCKHKHKKHKSSPDTEEDDVDVVVGEEEDLRIKLDGSFNNTTTYSIRSPIYHGGARSEESNHDDEEGDDESSEDDDGFSDDDHVTTVKAVSDNSIEIVVNLEVI